MSNTNEPADTDSLCWRYDTLQQTAQSQYKFT